MKNLKGPSLSPYLLSLVSQAAMMESFRPKVKPEPKIMFSQEDLVLVRSLPKKERKLKVLELKAKYRGVK